MSDLIESPTYQQAMDAAQALIEAYKSEEPWASRILMVEVRDAHLACPERGHESYFILIRLKDALPADKQLPEVFQGIKVAVHIASDKALR